jgi:signal transduction histidine kinase/ActR/RegA family two-component response regulator
MRHVRWLHRRINAWLLAVVLLACVWTAYAVQVNAIRDRSLHDAAIKSTEITAAYTRFVAGNLSLIDSVLRFIAVYDRENGLDKTVALVSQQRLFEAFHGNIVILDSAGQGVLINKNETGPISLADRPYIQQAVADPANEKLVIGTPVAARSSGKQVLPFARAVRRLDGTLIGSVAASIEVAFLQQPYDQAALGPGGVAVMTGTEDHVIRARMPQGTSVAGQTTSASRLWAELDKDPKAGSYWQVSTVDGKQRLYAYETLADFPIVITAGVALDDIIAESAQLRSNLRYAAGGISVVILLLLFGWLQELASRNALNAETRRADAASRAKSDFLASMSHELRTPLNGLLGFARLLRSAPLEDPHRRYVELLNDAGKHLYALINDILDFSKIEAGKMAFEETAIELRSLVDGAVAIAAPAAADKRLTLDCQLDPRLDTFVRGDPNRVRQVLLNLITNAIKFTPTGGVEIRVLPAEGARVRFEVQDTGIGIAAENQAKLFRRFEQLDPGTSRSHGGTGLGLAISASLVRLMAGDIGVVSRLGGGATFWFELPLPAVPHAELSLGATIDRLVGEHTRPLSILVAEDVPMNQMLVQSLLDSLGHQCTIVENGQLAVEAAAASRYDVILMDLQMPVMNGLDAARAIRAFTAPANLVPIIALTANAFAEDIAACKEAGMNDFVAKPLDFDRLAATIDRWAELVPAEV